MVLSNSTERVFSSEEGVEEVPLGLYLVKGETMYALSLCAFLVTSYPVTRNTIIRCSNLLHSINSTLIGELDAEKDSATDFGSIRADPLPPIRW